MNIWDIHAHVFPEKIVDKAVQSIGSFYGYPMETDGRVDTLLSDYRSCGIKKGVIHSVAVSPRQVESINRFIAETQSAHPEELLGFGTIHALCEDPEAVIAQVESLGLHGIKIHPDMQRFALDSPEAMRMFEALEGRLPVLIHTGDTRYAYSRPAQMQTVAKTFPGLTCICAHLGGWSEWEDAYRSLASCDNVWVDTSSSLYALSPRQSADIIRHYDRSRVLFGTDFPMWTPSEELGRFRMLPLSEEEQEAILWKNACALLGEGI